MVEPSLEDVFPGLRDQAYQLSGRWASKLGRSEDIEHALHDLTGTAYGKVVLIMKRPIT